MNIGHISVTGFRGITGTLALSDKTIVTGPNGAGKSTYAHAAEWVVNGHLSAQGPRDAILNAENGSMEGEMGIGDHKVARRLTRGKTVQERVRIDNGKWITASAASAALDVLFGNEPIVVDMSELWSLSSAELRRHLLDILGDADEWDNVSQREQEARTRKNDLQAEARSCEKAIARLTAQMAERDAGVGSVEMLKAQLAEAKGLREKLMAEIRDGEQNDIKRNLYQTLIQGEGDNRKKLGDLLKEQVDREVEISSLDAESTAHEARRPAEALSGRAAHVIGEVVSLLCDETKEGGSDPTSVLHEQIIEKLSALVPDATQAEALAAQMAEWKATTQSLRLFLVANEKTLASVTSQLDTARANLDGASKAKAEIDSVGAGPSEQSRATLAGVETRITETEEQILQAVEAAAVATEIEKSRIAGDDVAQKLITANEELAEATQTMSAMLQAVGDEVALRSKAVLTEGTIELVDDGKDVTLYWKKHNGPSVSRATLSGGERCMFDNAVAHVIAPDSLHIIEAAEIDQRNTTATLDLLGAVASQVAVFRWLPPESVPEGWTHVDLGAVEDENGEAA